MKANAYRTNHQQSLQNFLHRLNDPTLSLPRVNKQLTKEIASDHF